MHEQITVTVPVEHTPRVMQVSAMMDLPVEAKATRTWDHTLPLEEQQWSVGLVVGPSGAGKTILASRLWPDRVVGEQPWRSDAALLDDFPADMGVKQVTDLLMSVGLSSVPTWVRPFRTLSNGEQFRASMARALAETDGLVVVDEFTSVVDRQVAKVASHTIQKVVRRAKRQFVAVTCHYDVVDWLNPDWVYDVAAGTFQWRRKRPRPTIDLDIHEDGRPIWRLFAPHHYLSGSLHGAAKCYTAWADGAPVAFTSHIHFQHPSPKTRNLRMGHRLVVLPDYQGLGIGGRLDDWLGQHLYDQGYRYRNVVSHPGMIRYYTGSPRWQLMNHTTRLTGRTATSKALATRQMKMRRMGQRSFEYVPPKEKP